MGLFGGGNSSTSNQYKTNNIKRDQVIGNGAIGLSNEGDGNTTTVQVLDGGAIAGAFDFAKAASGNASLFADNVASDAFDFAKVASGNASLFADNVASDAFELIASTDARAGRNYSALLNTTSTAMRDLIGAQNSGVASILNGVGSMQNFIASTAASATGQLDNRTKMIIALAGLGVVALLAWGKK